MRPFVLFSMLVLVSLPVSAEEFRVAEDSVSSLDASGDILWTNRHVGAWTNTSREHVRVQLARPIRLGDTIFYSVGEWLFAAGAETGIIHERKPFPGPITAIEFDEGKLALTIEHNGDVPAINAESRDEATIVIRHVVGTPPPNESWSPASWLTPWHDVVLLDERMPGYATDAADLSPEARRELLAAVREASVRDPTNGLYDWMVGLLLLSDDPNSADRAFETAVNKPDMRGTTDIFLATLFDSIDQQRRADRAFDRGVEKVSKELPGLSNSWSLVPLATLFGAYGLDNIRNAVSAQDAERAHRLESRIYVVFPNVERSHLMWSQFAQWLDREGKPDYAEVWRKRAQLAADSPSAEIDAAVRYFDLSVAGVFGCILGAWLGAFILGVRSPRRGGRFPRPRLSEIGVLLLVAFATVPLLVVMGVTVDLVGTTAGAPFEILGGTSASPESIAFIHDLNPSEAKDLLLEQARARASAFAAGEPPPALLPEYPRLMVDALYADAIDGFFGDFGFANINEVGSAMPRAEASVAMATIPPVVLFLLGAFAGISQSVRRLLELLIPGGARSASFMTPFVCAAFCAAFGAIVLDYDAILQSHSLPNLSRFFGLDELEPDGATPSRMWAWVLLGAAVFTHVVTTIVDRFRDRTRDQSNGSEAATGYG